MLKRAAVTLACHVLLGGHVLAQTRPEVAVALLADDPPEASVRLRGLLSDPRFVRAMESGFPLYLEYNVELRESRPFWDRTVDEWGVEYVVSYDPVRETFLVEDPEGSEEFAGQSELAQRLGVVYVIQGLIPDHPGTFYYKATVNARTLSDEDVDEVFAWLKGEDSDSTRRSRPGLVTRAARRLLVRVSQLPRMQIDGRTRDFRR